MVPIVPMTGIYIVMLLIIFLAYAIRILREYERGVVFTLGRFTGVKGPGLIILVPFIQKMVRVDLRTIVLDVPSQDVISHDNVSVHVNAVVYFRVIDPEKAIIQVENFYEATSQLDSKSEELIKEAFYNLMKNKTTFVIAHRLSTIQKADKIIILEQGNIVGMGTHLSLLTNNKIYKKLYQLQFDI